MWNKYAAKEKEMRRHKKLILTSTVLVLVTAVGIGLATTLPGTVSRLAYAAETGRALAARGDL